MAGTTIKCEAYMCPIINNGVDELHLRGAQSQLKGHPVSDFRQLYLPLLHLFLLFVFQVGGSTLSS